MTKFIPFTEEQLIAANNIDIVELLKNQGESLKKDGKVWRWQRYTSLSIQGNKWYQHKYQEGGRSIKFLQRFYNMSFPEAVQTLLSFDGISITEKAIVEEKPKEFHVPQKNESMKHLYGYLLKTRFIDYDVINAFVKENLIYEDIYHNIIFAGYDEQRNMLHAHRKSTAKGIGCNVSGSKTDCSFHYIGKGKKVFVFEGPIDMMSYISLHKENWQEHTYIANCGLSTIPLFHQLDDNKNILEVNLCFDRDSAGDEATWRFKDELEEKGYNVNILESNYNDWNEDLKSLNGVDPKPAVINPKYAIYSSVLDKIESISSIQHVDHINFQSFMQSYAELIYKLDSDQLITKQIQMCFEDLAYKSYALFNRSYVIYASASDEHHISNMKDHMRMQYRTYKDRSELKTKINKVKLLVNDLKLHFHNYNGSYLSAEIASTYLELAEECAMASRYIETKSLCAPEEILSFKIPSQNYENINQQLGMK